MTEVKAAVVAATAREQQDLAHGWLAPVRPTRLGQVYATRGKSCPIRRTERLAQHGHACPRPIYRKETGWRGPNPMMIGGGRDAAHARAGLLQWLAPSAVGSDEGYRLQNRTPTLRNCVHGLIQITQVICSFTEILTRAAANHARLDLDPWG